MGMKLTKNEWLRGAGRQMGRNLAGVVVMAMALLGMAPVQVVRAQAVSTTTVQGTVFLANGQAGSGTLHVSWPAFTTANGLAVAADSLTVTIGLDGFVSVKLAPNQGATPAGLYYTAVFYMSDGTTSTQYWVVPAAAQASLAQVQSQLMPAAQAVQAVSKAYVDQAISELNQSQLMATGGTLTGPLYLNGDPTQALQASDKHYVDAAVSKAVPLAGGNMTGALGTPAVNGVQAPAAGSSQTTLQAAMTAAGSSGAMEIPPTYAGTDTFTNPNGVRVTDLRTNGAQQTERSVKEFGAVCDGATDDTNTLQTALNYAQAHGVALTIPQGTCKTRTLNWHGESIGGMGKQVSALMGFPGQDVLATVADSPNLLQYTRLHDLTIYVDQSADVSCSPAEGRAPAGSCTISRPLEGNSIFSPGGNGLTGTAGSGIGWAVGNCAIAMPAVTGTGGNGLRVAEIANVEIATTGADPMAVQYPGAHSTHTCGMYLAQWPQWSEFRNIDIRGLNTGIAMPALPGTTPAGLNADSNRWQNITIQATHGFTAAAGSNNVLDNVVALAGNSAAMSEPPTGLVLDLTGTQQGWTVRNAVVIPTWSAVQPQLSLTAAGGAVAGVSVGPEHGLGFDPYGAQVPLKFSGSCTATATASVNSDGSIGTINVTQGGVGCSGTTTASVNVAGTWDTAAAVNLIGGQNMTFFGGNLLKGAGGYTVWNAAGSESYGTQLNGGGGTLRGGGTYAAMVGTSRLGTTYQVDQFPGADFGAKLQSCLSAVSTQYGGDCDARNFTGSLSMGSNLTISTANTTVQLPCATIATSSQIIVTAGTRNVALRGCALRGGSVASGSQGGTVFAYSGSAAMVQVGDPTYATDTQGFHMDDVVINTTGATSATAQGLVAYRTQEMDLESLYFLGNANQTGMTLDGTGNYTGGTYFDNAFNGFQTAVKAIGHQVSNAATTDWMNASAFVRLHIDCPTSGGNPIAGTYGINLQQGDGNTLTGGDVEGCSTALHLGANAQNNTIVGLRNENSTNQVVADAGSAYNNWMTGGTMFTGKLTDNGTRNSFLDTFHRSFNGMNGDWYGSQQDATVTNHFRLGTGTGNERGLLNRYQSDYGYRWTTGLSDATAGEQFYQVLDELNNVYRLSIGQYNNGQASTNNQTVINAAGTGAVVLNGSNNAGTGGVVVGSGGSSASTVATINNAGNAQFIGTLQVGGVSTFNNSTTVKNQADAEIDEFLWAGATTSQKESLTYKDWNGNSQWYAVKDASNNWALNSATGGLDSFKAYQSSNSGDTYVNASNSSGVVRVNYETGAGSAFKIYGGSSSSLYASFTGTTSIQFPGLAAGSGRNCLQIDNSGYVSNTGSACGSGSGGGTVNSGNGGQIAYYTANGTTIGGLSVLPPSAGGTGANTTGAAYGNLVAPNLMPSIKQFGAVGDGVTDDSAAINTALAGEAAGTISCIFFPTGIYAVKSEIQWTSVGTLCMRGQSMTTTAIYFTGASSVDSAFYVNYGPGAGYSALDIQNMSFAANTNASYAFHAVMVGQGAMDNIAFSGGSVSTFEGDGWNGQQDMRNINVVNGGIAGVPFSCVNGLTFANTTESGTTYPSGQFSLIMPRLMGCSGTALNIQSGEFIDVVDGQLSLNGQNLFDKCTAMCNAPGNTYTDTLFEQGPWSTAAEQVYNRSTFKQVSFGGQYGVQTYTRVRFEQCQFGKLTAMSGFPGPAVVDSFLSGSQLPVDNSLDGIQYEHDWDYASLQPFNLEQSSRHLIASGANNVTVLHASYRFWNSHNGSYQISTVPVNLNNNAWTAFVRTDISGAPATAIELDQTTPTITLTDSATITIAQSSSGLTATIAGESGVVDGVLDIDFYPGAGYGYFTPALSLLLNKPVSIPAGSTIGQVGGNLSIGASGQFYVGDSNTDRLDQSSSGNGRLFSSNKQTIQANSSVALDVSGTDYCTVGTSGLLNCLNGYQVNGNTILPSTLFGYHGSSGTKVQLSDGTGTSGNLAQFDSNGNIANGPTPPAGVIVGTSDTQTLTNKSIAGSEINSGTLSAAYGGNGQDESSATGIGQWNSGVYSVSNAITPSTVTATGLMTGGNDTTRTTSTTISTTGFTTTGLVLPTVPVSTVKSGRCTVYWQMSSTSYMATFGIGMSNAPTNLWGGSSVTYAPNGLSNWLAFTQTATSPTAISTAATANAPSTTYRAEIGFALQTGATNPVAITIFGAVSNASATLTIEPGSACYWLP
jgi:hypothetical protein